MIYEISDESEKSKTRDWDAQMEKVQPNDKRKNRFSQAQIELWKKEQEDQEPRDAWLTESEEAIKRHMKDL